MTAPDQLLEHQFAIGRTHFGADWHPDRIARAPGRIELIGGHLDYNGGPVLAAAIDKQIMCSARENGQSRIRIAFPDFDASTVYELDSRQFADWKQEGGPTSPADFARGATASLLRHGVDLRAGIDIVASGDLPHGVGISSSAALCISLVQSMSGDNISQRDLVRLAQEAENRTGSPCGTMDQSASVYGQIIRFDGATNESARLDADLTGWMFVVANSGVVRSLAASVYPVRVRESKEALTVVRERYNAGLATLAAIPFEDLPKVKALMPDQPVHFRRIEHVVTETLRVGQAVAAVQDQAWDRFADIMTQGDISSTKDYEIGHPVVSELTSLATRQPYKTGARIMGGGEGGAALMLVERANWDEFRSILTERFYMPRRLDPDRMLIPCTFAPGASVQQI